MNISDRTVMEDEWKNIYADLEKIHSQNGIPPFKEERHRLVIDENEEIIGVADGYTNHKWFYFALLLVREDYRRQGLGTKLLVMLEEKLKEAGIEHIYLWTSGFINPKFCEKHGYNLFTVFENLYEAEGHHHMGYRKDLV